MDDYPELLRNVFSNDQGRKLLDIWHVNYGERLSFYAGNTPEETAFREGERSFYQHIINIMREANG
jgi:hypothetical protein